MAQSLAAEDGISVVNDVVLNQVAVRFGEGDDTAVGDELTLKTIAAVQQDGVCFAGGAKWKGQWIMRLSVIGFNLTPKDAAISVDAIIQAWRRVRPRK